MPINSVPQRSAKPQPEKEDDTFTKIIKGLEIAKGVLGVPVAIEQIRAYGAEANLKNAQADVAKGALPGKEWMPVPQAPSIQPPEQAGLGATDPSKPAITPPTPKYATAREFPGAPGKQFYNPEMETQRGETVAKKREEVNKIAGVANHVDTVAQGVYNIVKERGGVGGMRGTDDFIMIKALNQFNDTPRVTEGEVEAIKRAQPLLDRLLLDASRITESGAQLPPQLRNDILNTIKTLHQTSISTTKDALSAISNDVNAMGLPRDRIFSPKYEKLLAGEDVSGAPVASKKKSGGGNSLSSLKKQYPDEAAADARLAELEGNAPPAGKAKQEKKPVKAGLTPPVGMRWSR